MSDAEPDTDQVYDPEVWRDPLFMVLLVANSLLLLLILWELNHV